MKMTWSCQQQTDIIKMILNQEAIRMKHLFLASSFKDVAPLFLRFSEGLAVGKTITFIPTAALHEKVNFYVKAGKRALEKCGWIVDELEISSASADEIGSKLAVNPYVYVSGGNTFFLLQELKRTGTDKWLANHIQAGKPYVGESAGSIIVAPHIEYAKGMDDVGAAPDLPDFKGLGMVNFFPLPHHTNIPFKKAVEKIIRQHGDTLSLVPFSNSQAIVVHGDAMTMTP